MAPIIFFVFDIIWKYSRYGQLPMNTKISFHGIMQNTYLGEIIMSELIMPEKICKIGQNFKIELKSRGGSTGYICAIAHKPDCIWLEGEATYLIPGQIEGQTGKIIFSFICVAECVEQLVFKYVRTWDLKDIGQTVICPIVCHK